MIPPDQVDIIAGCAVYGEGRVIDANIQSGDCQRTGRVSVLADAETTGT